MSQSTYSFLHPNHSLLSIFSYLVYSLDEILSFEDGHSLQFLHAGHLLDNSEPMASTAMNSGGVDINLLTVPGWPALIEPASAS